MFGINTKASQIIQCDLDNDLGSFCMTCFLTLQMSKKLCCNPFTISMYFLQGLFLIIYFQQSIDFTWVVFYVAEVGANCTFHFLDVQKTTPTMDLVIESF